MIDRSSAYDQAITARRRRITVRATFDLRDPDAVVSGAASSTQSPYSQIAQVYDEITDQTDFKLGTLEQDRIQLDGSWALPPDDPNEVAAEQLGWWGGVVCGADGAFASPEPYIELTFTGMSILQAFTLWFSQNPYDGVPESFRVDVYSAATLAFSRTVEGNRDNQVLIDQFTVYDPTRIRVTMLKWSRPYTYPRLTDLFFGLFERWSGSDVYGVDVLTECTFTGLSLLHRGWHSQRHPANRQRGRCDGQDLRRGAALCMPGYCHLAASGLCDRIPQGIGTRLYSRYVDYREQYLILAEDGGKRRHRRCHIQDRRYGGIFPRDEHRE